MLKSIDRIGVSEAAGRGISVFDSVIGLRSPYGQPAKNKPPNRIAAMRKGILRIVTLHQSQLIHHKQTEHCPAIILYLGRAKYRD